DPYDIVIADSEFDYIDPNEENIFESSPSDSIVDVGILSEVLNSSGSSGIVIIRTSEGEGGDGDITIGDDIVYDIINSETATLRLEAHNNIVFESNNRVRRVNNGSGAL